MSSTSQNNILLISPESGFGGSEKSFAQLSKILHKHYNVHIIFFDNYTKPVYPLYGKIIYLNTPGAKNFISSIINIVVRIRKIRTIKNDLNISTSISFLEGANYLNILTKKKEKCIISIRGSIIHDPNIKFFGKIIRRSILIPLLYRIADRVVCISNGLKQEMMNHFHLKKDKIRVIYNSINCDEINNLRKETLGNKYEELFNNFTIISHGRIAPEKGIQYQLIILSKLLKKFPNLKLILIGDGTLKGNLINLCNKLNLRYFEKGSSSADPVKYHVIFWGYEKNPFKLLGKANLYISTSLTEGFGNSIIEAMACKCLTISSDCPYGPREIIIPENDSFKTSMPEYPKYHENGILMPVINNIEKEESTDLWVKTIEDIIHNKVTNYSSDAAFKRASIFSEKRLENNWINVIANN